MRLMHICLISVFSCPIVFIYASVFTCAFVGKKTQSLEQYEEQKYGGQNKEQKSENNPAEQKPENHSEKGSDTIRDYSIKSPEYSSSITHGNADNNINTSSSTISDTAYLPQFMFIPSSMGFRHANYYSNYITNIMNSHEFIASKSKINYPSTAYAKSPDKPYKDDYKEFEPMKPDPLSHIPSFRVIEKTFAELGPGLKGYTYSDYDYIVILAGLDPASALEVKVHEAKHKYLPVPHRYDEGFVRQSTKLALGQNTTYH